MKSLMILALLFLSHESQAEIHSVVRGYKGEPHLIKYVSGVVEFLNYNEIERLAAIEASLIKKPINQNKALNLQLSSFEPSIVNDSDLQSIFERMNQSMKRKSECSDRAHVWSRDEFQKTGTKSEKVFLMLTDAYIRRNRYKWWFHVAPMFSTTSGEKIVYDLQFLDRPVTFTEWKNLLVFSKRECVTDFKFLDYHAGADQSQDCYVKYEPMYYRIPGDIGNRERRRPMTDWNLPDVKAAKSRAFFEAAAGNESYYTVLRPVNFQSNGFIPYGMATFEVKEDQLKVSVSLDDDQPVTHRQTLHAGPRCPTLSDDTNGDGFVDYEEAMKVVGAAIMPLDADLNSQAAGADKYLKGPAMTYNKVASLTKIKSDLSDALGFEGKVVLVHGTSQQSSFPLSLATYKDEPAHLSLPVVCGVLYRNK